jgi:N-acetylmuramoyl-L-alanine amidase
MDEPTRSPALSKLTRSRHSLQRCPSPKRARFLTPLVVFALGALLLPLAAVVGPLPRAAGRETTVEVYDLRSFTDPTHTRIVIEVGKLREYAPVKAPDRICIDVYQARLNPILHGKTVTTRCDYLKEIRIAQKNETTVRLSVEVNAAKVDRYQVFALFDPFRIVLDIFPKTSLASASPASPPASPAAKLVLTPVPQPAEPTTQGYSMARQLGLGIRTVVIDAGHGGADPGAIGGKGLLEKDVVLDVSKELQARLEAKGLNVIMTRESDIYVPLENRAVIANQKSADLFVSIHANANRKKERKGIQTFFLNFSPDAQVIEIAARENATSTRTIGQMKDTLKKIVQNSKILESRDLADKIQGNLVKSLSQRYSGVEDLGVRGAPFWVLIGSEMPSVLVEISHLSNPQEEERLRSSTYRKQVAQAIYDGIVEYIRALGKG